MTCIFNNIDRSSFSDWQMWPLSMFILTITRHHMTHLVVFIIWSHQESYKMSSNHIKGRNLGTIWLSYMQYYPWKWSNSELKSSFKLVVRVPLYHNKSVLVSWSFVLHSQDLFRESYTYAIPDVSLKILCLSLFFVLPAVLLVSCGEEWSKWQQ